MPDYGHGIKEHDRAATSYYASLRRWLQIKKYQYEVTFSLYMLTSTEKIIFNVIVLVLLSLLITAAVAYLPNHVVVISNRLWYYAYGEPLFYKSQALQSGGALDAAGSVVRSVLSASSAVPAKETVEEAVRQMHEL